MRSRLLGLFALLVAIAAITPTWAQDPIAAAIASPDRPEADTVRDGDRKPAQLLAFAGVAPGQRVADIVPGSGYFTRLFSKAVGPKGKVYAILPAELVESHPTLADAPKAIAAQPVFANVVPLTEPSGTISAPEPVDIAWTSQNYHDIYGAMGADQAAKFDAAVYKMLRPGGLFIVIDHAAAPGTGDSAPKDLHRIDPGLVKAQLIAAGFVYEGASDLLRNPADTHELKVFDPAIRGHTDQFVFKFLKPKR